MKKSGVRLAAVFYGALMAATANAQTPGGFEVGVDIFDYGYREKVDGETVVTDDGMMVGMSIGYVETIGNGWFVRVQGAGARGDIDYASESGRIENVRQDLAQFTLELGRDFGLGSGASITPFAGIGGRRLWDYSGDHATDLGILGYDRDIFYLYIPTGVAVGVPVPGGSRLTFTAQYKWIVDGYAKSELSALDPALPDLDLKLKGGRGLEGSVNLSMPIGRRSINVGPFIRHWSINQSESFALAIPEMPGFEIEFSEPKNRTQEFGVRLSLGF